jgi:GNAT superfamily N-acetyltransferase
MLHLEKTFTRPLKACEVHLAQEWAVHEGWNPGPADSMVFHAADPGSLITVEADGAPVGVISAVRMTQTFGFIGFFVLAPAYRRSTYGWRLLQAAFERMGDRTIGGDGLLARVPAYMHFGSSTHHQTISHHGIAPARSAKWHPGIEPAAGTPLAELADYDGSNFGVPRTAFLREWLVLPGSHSLVFKQNGRLCGLGSARRCHHGVRIGPLQADHPEIAEALFDALVGMTPGAPISIDSPDTNPETGKLLRKKGMVADGVTTRLYRGEAPPGIPARVYGQMSFALG